MNNTDLQQPPCTRYSSLISAVTQKSPTFSLAKSNIYEEKLARPPTISYADQPFQSISKEMEEDVFHDASATRKDGRIYRPLPLHQVEAGSKVRSKVGKPFCEFCKNNNEQPEVFTSHVLKDMEGRVICPVSVI